MPAAANVTVDNVTVAAPVCVEATVDVSDPWTCAEVSAADIIAGYPGPIVCRKPEYNVEVTVVGGSLPSECVGVDSDGWAVDDVSVGATFEAGASCPVTGRGYGASTSGGRTSSRVFTGQALPGSLTGLSACGNGTLRVWVRSACTNAGGFSLAVTVGPDCLRIVQLYTLAASSSLAWPLLPSLFAHSAPVHTSTQSPHPLPWPGQSTPRCLIVEFLCTTATATAAEKGTSVERPYQGHPLVHFPAQPEPFLSLKPTETSQRAPQEVLTIKPKSGRV